MRRIFKSLSLPKSSLSTTSIGAATRFELLGIATLVGAIGKVALGFDDRGAGVVVVAELGGVVAKVGVLATGVELFVGCIGVLPFFEKLGLLLVFL